MQDDDSKRLCERLPQMRGIQPEFCFPGPFNRKPPRQGQGERLLVAQAC